MTWTRGFFMAMAYLARPRAIERILLDTDAPVWELKPPMYLTKFIKGNPIFKLMSH